MVFSWPFRRSKEATKPSSSTVDGDLNSTIVLDHDADSFTSKLTTPSAITHSLSSQSSQSSTASAANTNTNTNTPNNTNTVSPSTTTILPQDHIGTTYSILENETPKSTEQEEAFLALALQESSKDEEQCKHRKHAERYDDIYATTASATPSVSTEKESTDQSPSSDCANDSSIVELTNEKMKSIRHGHDLRKVTPDNQASMMRRENIDDTSDNDLFSSCSSYVGLATSSDESEEEMSQAKSKTKVISTGHGASRLSSVGDRVVDNHDLRRIMNGGDDFSNDNEHSFGRRAANTSSSSGTNSGRSGRSGGEPTSNTSKNLSVDLAHNMEEGSRDKCNLSSNTNMASTRSSNISQHGNGTRTMARGVNSKTLNDKLYSIFDDGERSRETTASKQEEAIVIVNNHDVLHGIKDAKILQIVNDHPANVHYKQLIEHYWFQYVHREDISDETIVDSIIGTFGKLSPPGRFLRCLSLYIEGEDLPKWEELSQDEIRMQTKSLLDRAGRSRRGKDAQLLREPHENDVRFDVGMKLLPGEVQGNMWLTRKMELMNSKTTEAIIREILDATQTEKYPPIRFLKANGVNGNIWLAMSDVEVKRQIVSLLPFVEKSDDGSFDASPTTPCTVTSVAVGDTEYSTLSDDDAEKSDDDSDDSALQLHIHDVKCGERGVSAHLGNCYYYQLLDQYLKTVSEGNPSEAVDCIIQSIDSLQPSGRFLIYDSSNGKWVKLEDEDVREKIRYALYQWENQKNGRVVPLLTDVRFGRNLQPISDNKKDSGSVWFKATMNEYNDEKHQHRKEMSIIREIIDAMEKEFPPVRFLCPCETYHWHVMSTDEIEQHLRHLLRSDSSSEMSDDESEEHFVPPVKEQRSNRNTTSRKSAKSSSTNYSIAWQDEKPQTAQQEHDFFQRTLYQSFLEQNHEANHSTERIMSSRNSSSIEVEYILNSDESNDVEDHSQLELDDSSGSVETQQFTLGQQVWVKSGNKNVPHLAKIISEPTTKDNKLMIHVRWDMGLTEWVMLNKCSCMGEKRARRTCAMIQPESYNEACLRFSSDEYSSDSDSLLSQESDGSLLSPKTIIPNSCTTISRNRHQRSDQSIPKRNRTKRKRTSSTASSKKKVRNTSSTKRSTRSKRARNQPIPQYEQFEAKYVGNNWIVPNSEEGGAGGLHVKLPLTEVRAVNNQITDICSKSTERNSFLKHLFGTRRIVYMVQLPTEEKVFNDFKLEDGQFEVVSAKIHKDHERSSRYIEQECVHYGYLQVSGPGIETVDPERTLASLGDFGALNPRKISARLELLQSPATKDFGKKDSAIFSLRPSVFSDIEEKGHVGCGWIEEEFLERMMMEKNSPARTTLSIQVRAFIPSMGIYKGMLMRKRNLKGAPIQFPTSMKKVAASKYSELHGEAWLVVCKAGVDPSSPAKEMRKVLDPSLSPSPSWRPKCLKKMIPRLFKGLGVKEDMISDYLTKRREEPEKHLKDVYVRGVADPTGWIPSRSVYLSGINGNEDIGKQILCTRSPCIKLNQIVMLNVVRTKPEEMPQAEWDWLNQLPFGIIIFGFPEEGWKSMPELINDGDLDGDRFFVCWDKDILKQIKADPLRKERGEFDKEPPSSDSIEKQKGWLEDARKVMLDATSMSNIGKLVCKLYSLSEKVADKSPHFMRDPDSIALADAYNEALKFGKHGDKIVLPARLKKMLPKKLQALCT